MKKGLVILVLIFGVSHMTGSLSAQRITAQIVGAVTDPTGASIPGVSITATQARTGIDYTTTTDEMGRYVLSNLPPGEYRMKAELPGFKALIREGILLQVDQTARLDLQLEIGEISETVTVQAPAPVISTDASSIGSVVENKQILNLPLNGRLNIVGLLALAPGVQNAGSQSAVPIFGITPNIAGGTNLSTYFTLDGVSNNLHHVERGTGNWPSLEAIQEFKVISTNASAEFGKGGAEVVVVTKAGTNELRGSLFIFNRNRITAAQNALVKRPEKPGFNRNEFGASVGGPVVLPGYNGRDRTFFFGSYEGFRLREPFPVTLNLPTMAMRAGDFAGLAAVSDPLTGQPFPDNRIPQNRLDQVAVRLQQFYPEPNRPGTGPAGTGNNFSTVIPRPQNVDRFSLRLDHRLTQRDQMYGRFLFSNLGPNPQVSDFSAFRVPREVETKRNIGEHLRSLAIVHTHTFTPRLINEFRFGYSFNQIFRTPQRNGLDTSQLIPGLPRPVFGGFPTVTVVGFFGFGEPLPGSGDKAYMTQYIDNVTISRGAHLVKAGYEAHWVDHFNIFNPSPPRGGFTFQNRYTGSGFGNAYADFLLGFPVTTARPDPGIPTQFRSWRHFAFVQDDWKASTKLTLNLGLRYEYQPVQSSKFGLIADFDPSLGRILVFGDQLPQLTNFRMVESLPISLARDVGRPSDFGAFIGADKNNFGPRFGFAWQPLRGHRFVVRGGYGVFYYMIPNTRYKDGALLSYNPPFLAVSTFESDPRIPTLPLSNPFPGAGALPRNPSLGAMERGYVNPYSQQWNLTLEHELHPELAVRASYVGNKGTKLLGNYDLNAVTPQPGPVQPRRPYQPFAAIMMEASRFSSITHELQLGATKRYSRGLSFQVEYQFVRALGDDGFGGFDDPFNIRLSRGDLNGIRRHGLVANYIWDLPFGPGQRWLRWTGVGGAIVGGWQITGITTFFTGAPFSVVFSSSVAGCPSGRADIVGNPIPAKRTPDRWFEPSAFRPPDGCRYGNSPRNFLFGPNQHQWDIGLLKNNKLSERTWLQFRAEFFNIFNHPQFGLPASNISSPATVGRISSSFNERQIQFALKLLW